MKFQNLNRTGKIIYKNIKINLIFEKLKRHTVYIIRIVKRPFNYNMKNKIIIYIYKYIAYCHNNFSLTVIQ